jgi:hypothetical protein
MREVGADRWLTGTVIYAPGKNRKQKKQKTKTT